MTKLNTDIEKEFIDKIEKALVLSTLNLSPKFLLYDIWEYNKDPYPVTHQTQYKYFEKLFYGDLEVIGGAFSVLEKYANVPLLLFRKNRNHSADVKDSDFFWLPYEVKYYNKESATLIDTTFLSTRESQRLDESGPDFLRFINKILNRETYKFSKFTKCKYDLHNALLPFIYCDSAEIITICLSYIIILEKYKIANAKSTHFFSKKHIETLSFEPNESIDVVKYFLNKNSDSFFDKFIGRIGGIPNTFFERLGIPVNSPVENIKVKIEEIITQDFKITNFLNYDECLGLIHTYARFPIIPYILIYWYKSDRIKDNQTAIYPCHLVFPVWNSYVFQPNIRLDKKIVSEGKVIFALLTVNDNFYFNSDNKSDNNFSILSRIIHKLGYIISDTVFYNKFAKKSIQNQATRAAISQVLARNTSHNIGAHVMNKLIGDLSKVKIDGFTNYKSNMKLYDASKNANEQLLDQISIFNNYVKCRMDYLADISFGTPLMQTNKYAYADLFKELDKVRLLLEHISGLDKFEFEIKFQKNGEDLNDTNDLLVAIPNDILGTQAFYNILENIIRNSAKHSDKSKLEKESVVFTVNFIDDVKSVANYCECKEVSCTKAHKKEIENALNEFIALEVYDNIPVEKPDEKLDLEESDIKEFIDKKTPLPKDNKFSSYIDKLVFSQNKKLNEDILSENSKLRSYSLGIVEMDASAAYLRKRPVEYINHRSYDIQYDESWSRNTEENKKVGRDELSHRGSNCRHFLKAFKKTEGDKNYLGYRFFLHRPAVVLVVTELLIHDKVNKENLRKEGIWLLGKEIFEKELVDGKVFPHEFVLIDSSVKFEKIEEIDFLEYYKTSLPIRILNIANEALNTLLETEQTSDVKLLDAWESECWDLWYKDQFFDVENNKAKVCTNHSSENHRVPFSVASGIGRSCYSIVLLDHLYSENSQETSKEKWCKALNLNPNRIEALSSLAQSKMPDFHKHTRDSKDSSVTNKFKNDYLPKANNPCLITKKKIIEAALLKVIVIDERIQITTKPASDGGKDFMSISFKDLYEQMGVVIPEYTTINLSENSFEPIKKNVENYILDNINNSEKTDFILIHYSILERMYNKEEINEKLNSWAKSINVVITSGRGTPDNLSANVRFANLSSVINAFVEIRSKYAINYLLNSTRKTNKI